MPDLIQPDHLDAIQQMAANHPALSIQRRAHLLLLLDAGHPNAEVARTVGLSISSVLRWRRLYREKGMDIFPKDADQLASAAAPEPAEAPTPDAAPEKGKDKKEKENKKKDKTKKKDKGKKKGKKKDKTKKKDKGKKKGKKKDKTKKKDKGKKKGKGKKGGKKAKPKT